MRGEARDAEDPSLAVAADSDGTGSALQFTPEELESGRAHFCIAMMDILLLHRDCCTPDERAIHGIRDGRMLVEVLRRMDDEQLFEWRNEMIPVMREEIQKIGPGNDRYFSLLCQITAIQLLADRRFTDGLPENRGGPRGSA